MGHKVIRGAAALVLVGSFVADGAYAQERGPGALDGSGYGVRPFIGATGDLNVHGTPKARAVTGNRVVLGADLYIGPTTGLAYAVGMHMGAGESALYLQPLFEVHYRFETPIPLVPWVGGGVSMKLGVSDGEWEPAATFRFVSGLEFFITDAIALGMQLALPDMGPSFRHWDPVANVEFLFGPHFRF